MLQCCVRLSVLRRLTNVLWLNGVSYQKTVCRRKSIGNGLWGIKWLRDRWCHV